MKKVTLFFIAAFFGLVTYGQRTFKKVEIITYKDKEQVDSSAFDVVVWVDGDGDVESMDFPQGKVTIESEYQKAGEFHDAPIYWFNARSNDSIIRGAMLKYTNGCFFVLDKDDSNTFTAFFEGMNINP
jgi:hypothetical protein